MKEVKIRYLVLLLSLLMIRNRRGAFWSLDFAKRLHVDCAVLADGTIENFDVIQRTAYMDGPDDEFKRKFVKAMLKRLNLTAADLPGINLEPILGAGR